MKACLVLTTINDPVCLEGYYSNFEKHGHLKDVIVVVIPDLKTPKTVYQRCTDLRRKGLKIFCPTPKEQIDFLDYVGFPQELIPFNSDNRRNVGFLLGLYWDCDFIISIDDDNYCQQEYDFLYNHACVGERFAIKLEQAQWFNKCSLLGLEVYPRGYPYTCDTQHEKNHDYKTLDIHINEGLWLKDPDVDPITWIKEAPLSQEIISQSVAIDGWSPINTQNTSIIAEAIPAWYFWDVGDKWGYGDIYSGYFVQKCMKHLGGYARFGTPVVDHERNSHNHFSDLVRAAPHIKLLEEWLPWLLDTKIEGKTYYDCAVSLADKLLKYDNDFIKKNAKTIKIWADAAKELL